jgi:hypothetical protein
MAYLLPKFKHGNAGQIPQLLTDKRIDTNKIHTLKNIVLLKLKHELRIPLPYMFQISYYRITHLSRGDLFGLVTSLWILLKIFETYLIIFESNFTGLFSLLTFTKFSNLRSKLL